MLREAFSRSAASSTFRVTFRFASAASPKSLKSKSVASFCFRREIFLSGLSSRAWVMVSMMDCESSGNPR